MRVAGQVRPGNLLGRVRWIFAVIVAPGISRTTPVAPGVRHTVLPTAPAAGQPSSEHALENAGADTSDIGSRCILDRGQRDADWRRRVHRRKATGPVRGSR